MHRADYEVYTFNNRGTKYWAFDVEYFGHYVAKSKKQIKKKIEVVKLRVAARLERIEIENKLYYERLNRETDELVATLKRYREEKEQRYDAVPAYINKKAMIQQIRDMLLMGATLLQIMEEVPGANPRIVSHVKSHMVAKKLL